MANKDGCQRTLLGRILQWEEQKNVFSTHFQDSKCADEKMRSSESGEVPFLLNY